MRDAARRRRRAGTERGERARRASLAAASRSALEQPTDSDFAAGRWWCRTGSPRSRWCASRRCPPAPDLDQLIRWQVRKAAPFRIEDAQVAGSPASPLPGRRPRVPGGRRAPGHHRRVRAGRATPAGAHAGIVDLASFNLINAVLGGRLVRRRLAAGARRGGLRHARGRPRRRRRRSFATVAAAEIGDLPDLVHQTAMYHEDRLGGGGFARIVLAGASVLGAAEAERLRRLLEERIGCAWRPSTSDRRPSCATGSRRRPELLDALAPSLGVLLETGSRGEPTASDLTGGWRSAAHQPLHAPVLQRARRPACCSSWPASRRRFDGLQRHPHPVVVPAAHRADVAHRPRSRRRRSG